MERDSLHHFHESYLKFQTKEIKVKQKKRKLKTTKNQNDNNGLQQV